MGIRRSLVFLGLVAFLLIFHAIGWLYPIETFLRGLIQPSSQAIYLWKNAGPTIETFKSPEELMDAYTALSLSSVLTEARAVRLDVVEEENRELRELLHFAQMATTTPIGAEIIGKNLDPIGSTLIAVSDAASLDQVAVGDPVIAEAGILVGSIIRKEQNMIFIQVLNDPQSRIGASVLDHPKTMGVIEGGYGNSLRMNLIPQQETIRVHDRIVSSGIEKEIPYGLWIGTVSAVETEPYRPFQSAIITPAYTLQKIQRVFILPSL